MIPQTRALQVVRECRGRTFRASPRSAATFQHAALQTAQYDDLLDAAVRGNVADVRPTRTQPSATVHSRFFTASRGGSLGENFWRTVSTPS